MTVKKMYRFKRADGGVTVSPIKPECEYTEMSRIIADNGKVVTKDGVNCYGVVDTKSTEGWYEVNAPEETLE